MSDDGPEFSRRVPLARIGAAPFHQDIAATAAECAALARRFELVTLDRLTAAIALQRQGRGTILLRAEFDAAFVQESVDTLEPVPGTLHERFALLYGPDAAAATVGVEDEAAFEPLAGDAIDVGEAVAQEFSLALPQFPHDPEAPGDPVAEAGADPTVRPAEEPG